MVGKHIARSATKAALVAAGSLPLRLLNRCGCMRSVVRCRRLNCLVVPWPSKLLIRDTEVGLLSLLAHTSCADVATEACSGCVLTSIER